MKEREVTRIIQGEETSDGAGVRLKRSLGSATLNYLDPFLLLDEFKSEDSSDYIAGFPDHPHRGFETVTYMLAGAMEHRDHKGNHGNLRAGSVQWMTAGRGIIHSEMPKQKDGLMWGFQLWVNLPAKDKMTAPRYQDIPPETVPEVERGGVRVRVITGESGGVRGAVTGIATDPLYIDVSIVQASTFEQAVPPGHTAFVYVYEGEGDVSTRPLTAGQLGVLSDGGVVRAKTSEHPMRFLLIAAKPLNEPMARMGPFVMNTRDEVMQAFRDYQNGTLAS